MSQVIEKPRINDGDVGTNPVVHAPCCRDKDHSICGTEIEHGSVRAADCVVCTDFMKSGFCAVKRAGG